MMIRINFPKFNHTSETVLCIHDVVTREAEVCMRNCSAFLTLYVYIISIMLRIIAKHISMSYCTDWCNMQFHDRHCECSIRVLPYLIYILFLCVILVLCVLFCLFIPNHYSTINSYLCSA